MKKKLTRNDIAAIKRAAASIMPLATKQNKLMLKKLDLQDKIKELQDKIDALNVPVKEMTGYNVDELVYRTVDKKFVFKYDTIIPEIFPDIIEDIKLDEAAVVDEVETMPAESPFNPIN